MLEIRNISKRYRLSNYRRQRVFALQGVSLCVGSGMATAIVGESGSGKSTLCRLVLGLERPDSGSVLWQGKDVRSYRRKDLYRQIQPVFQDNLNSLDPRWTVERSIAEPLRNDRRDDREVAHEVERLLDLMELSSSLRTKRPHELSGGQQKRVCIARALSINPSLMVLDEAVSGLDRPIMQKILTMLRELKQRTSCSYLFVTHNIEAALYLADTIAVMKGGQILETVRDPRANGAFEHPYSRELMRKHIQPIETKRSEET